MADGAAEALPELPPEVAAPLADVFGAPPAEFEGVDPAAPPAALPEPEAEGEDAPDDGLEAGELEELVGAADEEVLLGAEPALFDWLPHALSVRGRTRQADATAARVIDDMEGTFLRNTFDGMSSG